MEIIWIIYGNSKKIAYKIEKNNAPRNLLPMNLSIS